GPLGIRWRGRLVPRLEHGEIACYDLPTRYRARRWMDLAPRVGNDVFVKLFTHGTQERHSSVLLSGGLQSLFEAVRAGCQSQEWGLFFVSCWEMYQVIEALRLRLDPVAILTQHEPALP